MATVLPDRIQWEDFTESVFDWQQGEHVVCIAPTGRGKSTLMRSLLWQRDWAVVLCSKKKDRTYDRYLAEGYTRSAKWPPPPPPKDQLSQHVLLWPQAKTLADLDSFSPVFRRCLDDVFIDENWAVGLDDLYYLCVRCKLKQQIEALNYQTRSVGVSLVSGMQRPAWVPRSCWDQTSHAFVRSLSDLDDLRTIRGLSRANAKELEVWTRELRPYEWLYLPVAHGDSKPPVIVKPPA